VQPFLRIPLRALLEQRVANRIADMRWQTVLSKRTGSQQIMLE
jgi:hypothetical protein